MPLRVGGFCGIGSLGLGDVMGFRALSFLARVEGVWRHVVVERA